MPSTPTKSDFARHSVQPLSYDSQASIPADRLSEEFLRLLDEASQYVQIVVGADPVRDGAVLVYNRYSDSITFGLDFSPSDAEGCPALINPKFAGIEGMIIVTRGISSVK